MNLKTGVGNVTSAVIAQNKYLWIVNTLPLNIKQCICTAPKEGGAKDSPDVFPLQFNWTSRLTYIGRENIGIEYVYNTQRLDHWNYGPHHVWTVPETGSIIRMWQPFNGLQTYYNWTALPAKIEVEKICTSGILKFNVSCKYPSPEAPPQ